MSFTDAQYNALVSRIELIEDALNNLMVAVSKLPTTDSLRQINLVRQQEVDEIQTDITTLEGQVAILTSEVFK